MDILTAILDAKIVLPTKEEQKCWERDEWNDYAESIAPALAKYGITLGAPHTEETAEKYFTMSTSTGSSTCIPYTFNDMAKAAKKFNNLGKRVTNKKKYPAAKNTYDQKTVPRGFTLRGYKFHAVTRGAFGKDRRRSDSEWDALAIEAGWVAGVENNFYKLTGPDGKPLKYSGRPTTEAIYHHILDLTGARAGYEKNRESVRCA
jgi:hypothetical protein